MEGNGQLQAPAASNPGEQSLVHIVHDVGGPQGRSGRYGEKKSSATSGNRNLIPGLPACSVVAIPSELSRSLHFLVVIIFYITCRVNPSDMGLVPMGHLVVPCCFISSGLNLKLFTALPETGSIYLDKFDGYLNSRQNFDNMYRPMSTVGFGTPFSVDFNSVYS
jgi:hypothetical protein